MRTPVIVIACWFCLLSSPVDAGETEETARPRDGDADTAGKKTGAGPTVELGGRLQLDAAVYDDDISRLGDGTEVRRARLFAKGELGRDWAYKLQYDFTESGADGIKDAYVDYRGPAGLGLRLGHFEEPFSLQAITSSKYITFIERGLPHSFAEGRNIGVQLSASGDHWSLAAGAFGEGPDGAEEGDEGFGFSGRGTYLPLLRERHLLHMGGSVSYRSTGSADTLRFRARPESHLTDTRLVDTGDIDAEDLVRVVAEAAYVNGPLALQGEYYRTAIDRAIGANPNVDFDGFYIEGSWFLTGESLSYQAERGRFGRVNPSRPLAAGGWGAWQVAVRFSHLDLTDADINGGVEDNVTLGINWYPLSYLRFSVNYTNVLKVKGGPNPGDEPHGITLRGQVEF